MAVYQGADTMEAGEGQSLWASLQGQKRHRGGTEETLGKRGIFSAISDIIETGVGFIPGIGQIAKPILDVISKQAEQKIFKLEEYEDEPGFWTSKQEKKYREESEDIRKGADFSLLESIFKTGKEYIGSEVGSEVAGNFGDSFKKMFSGDEYIPYHGGDYFSPDFLSELASNGVSAESSYEIMKNGGRVPKYENGGFLSKLKFGKKKKESKVPERDEVLVALDAILSLRPPVGEHRSKRNGSGGYQLLSNVLPYISDKGQSRWKGRQIAEFDTSEGKRYYPGEGTSVDMQMAIEKAMMDATQRMNVSPADSITTDQFAKLKELGLFKGGGMVESSPTILDYFAKQNKTLDGSNTDSLSQRLRRR